VLQAIFCDDGEMTIPTFWENAESTCDAFPSSDLATQLRQFVNGETARQFL
jgi:hypothetical protein